MQCYFCSNQVELSPAIDDFQGVSCKNCGRYKISGSLAATISGMFDSGELSKRAFEVSGYIRECTDRRLELPQLTTSNIRDIVDSAFAVRSVHEKLGRVAKHISRVTEYFGQPIEILYNLFSVGYCANSDELRALLQALQDADYLDSRQETNRSGLYSLTVKGVEFSNSVKESDLDSRKVFVAMWFDDTMKKVYRGSIFPALEDCGYRPLIISDKEYLNDVTDQILFEIKQSKFVVVDLTGSRGGVYFEAGFAYGLGKPVVWTCRKDWFTKEHVHFDVEHFPFIIWETEAELAEKIRNRVKAVL